MDYKALEKSVYDHLMKRHERDHAFTFSVRQKGSKGAERDYFIGTEKSNYFGFTLWDIPSYYPGSSSDLFNFMIMIGDHQASVKFQFFQTRSSVDFQNEIDLELGKRVLQEFKKSLPKEYQLADNDSKNKMAYFDIHPIRNSFSSEAELLKKLDALIDYVSPIIDEKIAEVKEENPQWLGGRINSEKFAEMQDGLKRRFEKYLEETSEELPEGEIIEGTEASEKGTQSVSLNQILFGPPGTGKTYLAKSEAVQIIDGGLPATREKINQRYVELSVKEQIKFVTFHQSMNYEDFVEGIKPELINEGEEKIGYKIEDGIFKRMCVLAAYEYIIVQKTTQAATKTITFSQRYEELLNRFQQQIDEDQQVLIPLKSGQSIELVEISSFGNFILQHQNGQRTYTVSKTRLEKLYNEIDDFDGIPNIYSYFRSVIGGSNASAYWAVLNQLYELTPEPDLQEEKPVDYDDKRKAYERINWNQVDRSQDVPRYFLIIDEISRGNVASILGELITLLEDDKRGGQKESLEAILPYSKTKFSVPPNLYIIGTMNTADRSVEALDTALRRRFDFKEIAPNPELLSPKSMIINLWNRKDYSQVHWDEDPYSAHSKVLYEFLGIQKDYVEKRLYGKFKLGKLDWNELDLSYLKDSDFSGIQLNKLLEKINNRIRKLIDKDHMIGHAYFMRLVEVEDPVYELKSIFHNKILPLLQEYFYGNFGKIQLVLGKPFVVKDKDDIVFADADFEGTDYQDREVYQIKDVMKMNDEEFIAAVKQIYTRRNEA